MPCVFVNLSNFQRLTLARLTPCIPGRSSREDQRVPIESIVTILIEGRFGKQADAVRRAQS